MYSKLSALSSSRAQDPPDVKRIIETTSRYGVRTYVLMALGLLISSVVWTAFLLLNQISGSWVSNLTAFIPVANVMGVYGKGFEELKR